MLLPTKAVVAALIVASLAPLPCDAQDAVADFYKGRQISIMVGFSPGGSSSLYAQALARHMGRYLPGNPSFIVQLIEVQLVDGERIQKLVDTIYASPADVIARAKAVAE